MMAFSECKMAKYTNEEFERYGIFDDVGDIIGVKDDAPADFKQAFAEDQRRREEWDVLGID